MKKTLLFLVFNFQFLFLNTFAQSPNWLWANSAGGNADDIANSVTTDASGNIISTGDFYSSGITFGSTTLNSGGGGDMFIVKYDAAGNVLWAKSAGGNLEDRGLSVTADASGNIIAVGYFSSAAITFDTITLTNTNAGPDMYIVKYDAAGNVIWARSAVGTSYDGAGSVTTDNSGNIFISGTFTSPTLTFDTITLTNTGGHDFYIVKFDPAGNVLWARSASGNGWDYGFITSDDSGNVIATGTYLSPTLTFGSTTLINAGVSWDIFIVKYDAEGNLDWAKTAGGTGSDGASSVTSDASGNIILAGSFGSTAISFDTITFTTPGMFIVKFNGAGNALWANLVGGASASSIASDAAGNIIAAGSFYTPTITIGSTTFTNTDTVNNTSDLFIAKYDSSGNFLWANSAGGNYSDAVYSITTNASGKIIAAGIFYSTTIDFGSTTLTNAINSGNTYDLFIAKLDTTTITGVNETNKLMKDVLLFPNPATNQFTMFLESNNKKMEVTITDLTGKVIYFATANNSDGNQERKIEVNTSNFTEGVYVVNIQTENFFKTKKLIVIK